jgi:hypothetical protein
MLISPALPGLGQTKITGECGGLEELQHMEHWSVVLFSIRVCLTRVNPINVILVMDQKGLNIGTRFRVKISFVMFYLFQPLFYRFQIKFGYL